jgi:hypothetical protein
MRENQLPVSAARWQHGFQICFATFNQQKITKLLKKQQPLKLEKKNKQRLGILRILEKFRFKLNLETIEFYLIKLGSDFY